MPLRNPEQYTSLKYDSLSLALMTLSHSKTTDSIVGLSVALSATIDNVKGKIQNKDGCTSMLGLQGVEVSS